MKTYKTINILVTSILLLVLFIACSDDKGSTLETPTVESISPGENLKPNMLLTIKGQNLNDVKQVRFGAKTLVNQSLFVSQSNTEIILKTPSDAPSGEVFLIHNSNLYPNILAGEITMMSSSITDVYPLNMIPGQLLTIMGLDLDLVENIKIGTTTMSSIELKEPTKLEVVFPSTMTIGGVLTLIARNGEEVSFANPISIGEPYYTPVIRSFKPASVRAGQNLTILGEYLQFIDKIIFGGVEIENFTSQTNNSLELIVPNILEAGATDIIFVTSIDEKIQESFNILGGTDPVEDPSLVIFDFEDRNGNNSANNAGGWGGIADGKSPANDGVADSFFEIRASNWKLDAYWWVADNWVESPFPSISGLSDYVLKMDIRLRKDIKSGNADVRMMIAGSYEANFLPYLLKDDVWTTGGDWVTITIPLTAFKDLPDPTPSGGNWGIVKGDNSDGIDFTGFCVDNIRYELKK